MYSKKDEMKNKKNVSMHVYCTCNLTKSKVDEEGIMRHFAVFADKNWEEAFWRLFK